LPSDRLCGLPQIPRGREAWVDWQGIDYSTRWWEEICAGIENADNFVLILSPDSLNSIYCHREIEHARKHNKRIIPFIYRAWDEKALVGGWYTVPEMRPHEAMARANWETLQAIQYIDYPGKLNADFDRSIDALLSTVDTDPERVRLHTRLLLRLRDWEGRGRSPSALLRGDELAAYETWLAQTDTANDEPRATADQRAYIAESRRVEDDEQRQDALRERRIGQFRVAAVVLGIVMVAALIAGVILAGQANDARDLAATAAIAQEISAARERGANTQVAIIGQTLTPVPPTLTAVASAVADARDKQEIARLIADANLRIVDGDLNRALQIGDHMVAQYPNQAGAYLGRGLVLTNVNQLDEAIVDYTQALKLDPQYAVAYYNRGIVYAGQGKLDEAIADYTQAIEIDPQYAAAYDNRGLAYADQGRLNEAIADYTQALQIDPRDSQVYYNRGNAYYDQGDLDEAIADYTQAIQLDSEYAKAYHNRGLAYADQRKLEVAIADFTQAIRLDSTYALAYRNRGNSYFLQGKLETAIADYTQAIQLDPQYPAAYYNRGQVYFDQGKLEEAIADFTQVIELDPQDSALNTVYLDRGYSYYLATQFAKALADWETYKQLVGELPLELQSIRAEMQAALTATPTMTPIATRTP